MTHHTKDPGVEIYIDTDVPYEADAVDYSGELAPHVGQMVEVHSDEDDLTQVVDTQMVLGGRAHSPGVPSRPETPCLSADDEGGAVGWDDRPSHDEWSPALSKALREQSSTRSKLRTPRTLTRLMQQHREKERHRHHGLNATIQEISSCIPGYQEAHNETKIVKLQRIISYICHLESHIQALCEAQDIGIEFKNLFLSPHIPKPQEYRKSRGSVAHSRNNIASGIDSDTDLFKLYQLPAGYNTIRGRAESRKISSPTIDSTTEEPLLDAQCLLQPDNYPLNSPQLNHIEEELRAKLEARASSLQSLKSRGSRPRTVDDCGPLCDRLHGHSMPWNSSSGYSEEQDVICEPLLDDPDFMQLDPAWGDEEWMVNDVTNKDFPSPGYDGDIWGSQELPLSPTSDAWLHDAVPAVDEVPIPHIPGERPVHEITGRDDPPHPGLQHTDQQRDGTVKTGPKIHTVHIKQEPGVGAGNPTRLVVNSSARPTSKVQVFRVKTQDATRGDRIIIIIKQELPTVVKKLSPRPASTVTAPTTMTNTLPDNTPQRDHRLHSEPYPWRYHTINEKTASHMDLLPGRANGLQPAHEPTRTKSELGPVRPRRVDHRKTSWMNGFMMYSRMHRRQYIGSHPGMHTSHVSRLMGVDWRELTEEQRRPYREKAREFTRLHLQTKHDLDYFADCK